MNLGNIVKWNEYFGMVIETRFKCDRLGTGWTCLVYWADGGVSCMYRDELEVICEV